MSDHNSSPSAFGSGELIKLLSVEVCDLPDFIFYILLGAPKKQRLDITKQNNEAVKLDNLLFSNSLLADFE